jgi:peptidoglycan/LPS O-acetylase OafA/YrhL
LLTVLAAAPVVSLIAIAGPVWTVEHYFWVDLAAGPAVGMLLASVAVGRPAPLVSLLDTRPSRGLGSFSYSLYLTHAPVVVVVSQLVVVPKLGHGTPAFLLTLAIAGPGAVIFARLFAAVFELPFQRHKSWPALRAAIGARLRRPATQDNAVIHKSGQVLP